MYLSQMPDKYDTYTESTPAIYETDITLNLSRNKSFAQYVDWTNQPEPNPHCSLKSINAVKKKKNYNILEQQE